MGEIADMMLDGTMCQYCGVYLHEGEDGAGYPQSCDSCNEDGKPRRKKNANAPKMKCILCDRMIKKIGMGDHLQANHAGFVNCQADLLVAVEKAERLLIHLAGTQEMPPAPEYVSQIRRECLAAIAKAKGAA